MDRERWERIQGLFHEAADLPQGEQREFVMARAGDDSALAEDILALLAEDARGDSPLDHDLAEFAGRVLSDARRSEPPRELGPYRLGALLGEGGMGIVYLAERSDLRNRVAIKFLRDAWLSPARRERFAGEQRTLAQLNHPSIARLYDADTLSDGTPWFAMEYVEGVPLTDYCIEKACSTRQLLGLFRAVCEAVLHAHQRAVIHRDLKPSNILVTAEGQPKLLDFGIAKQLEGLERGGDWTRPELRLMTPAYAAPEQLRGEPQGVHTDVYSLGAILYELLTTKRLHGASEPLPLPERPSLALRKAAPRSERARALAAERGVAWPDLDVLCLTAVHADPVRRYRSVESLIRDLDHYLRGEPLEARPDSVRYRLAKFVRRHWRAVSAAAAALVMLVALVTFYTSRVTAARNVAVAEAERTRRIQEFMNGLFEGGDESAGPAESLHVVTLLERGVREAGALSGEPAVQAELYQTLGGIYHKLGQFEEADSLLQAALDTRRKQVGRDHPDVARNLVALGLLRADQTKFEEAERLVTEGLELSRRREASDPAAVARATTALGIVLDNQGKYERAITVLTEAARLDSMARLPAGDISATLTALANAHFYAGNYALSDSLNRRVLTLDRAVFGEKHPHVASDLINLGAIQQEMGAWAEAERYYRQALEIYRNWYGENHYETAASLNMVGRTLVQQGRLAEARAPLREALATRERIYGAEHPNVASTLNELALLAQKEGRFDEAEAGFRRMAGIYQAVYEGKHYLIGLALTNLAGVEMERKRYAAAERFYRDAIAMYARTLPANHQYTGIARIKLGRALLRQKRYADAEKETRAGYDIVVGQQDPNVTWLQNARRDLVEEYEGLKRGDLAEKYREAGVSSSG